MKTLSTEGRILRAVRLRPMSPLQLAERLALSSRAISAATRALAACGHISSYIAESESSTYTGPHWRITAAGAQSSDNGEWMIDAPPCVRGATRSKLLPAGNLRDADLAAIAIYAVQRMTRSGAGETWAMWRDACCDVYFEVNDDPAAQAAAQSPDRVIGFYRQGLTLATRVSKHDILADMQIALAELNAQALGGVAA